VIDAVPRGEGLLQRGRPPVGDAQAAAAAAQTQGKHLDAIGVAHSRLRNARLLRDQVLLVGRVYHTRLPLYIHVHTRDEKGGGDNIYWETLTARRVHATAVLA
jgi:hypothetical protein